MPAGRPSTYTTELGQRIAARIAGGEMVKTICLEEDMPPLSTVMTWACEHPKFSTLYQRARRSWAQCQAEDMISIADDDHDDAIETDAGPKCNTEFVQRSRLKVETRKWLISKYSSADFGDKQTIDSTTTIKVESERVNSAGSALLNVEKYAKRAPVDSDSQE